MYDNKYNQIFTEEELSTEVWKDVPEYEGLYQVSNLGRVKSLDRISTCKDGRKRLYKGKLLSPCKVAHGYFQVLISKGGTEKQMYIHRLVSQSFIPNPYNLPYINHINEDKTNNKVDNLEWCTPEYNNNYGTRNERISKSVIMCDINGKELKKFDSMLSAERYLNKPKGQSNISKCCNGNCKTAYGYKWKYK